MLSYLRQLFSTPAKSPVMDTVLQSITTGKKHLSLAESSKQQKDIAEAISFFTAAIVEAEKKQHTMLAACYMLRSKAHRVMENRECELNDIMTAYRVSQLPLYIYRRAEAHMYYKNWGCARADMVLAMSEDLFGQIFISLENKLEFLTRWIQCEKQYEIMMRSDENVMASLVALKQFKQKEMNHKSPTFDHSLMSSSEVYLARSRHFRTIGRYEEARSDLIVARWLKLAINKLSVVPLVQIAYETLELCFEMNYPERLFSEIDTLLNDLQTLPISVYKTLAWLDVEVIAKTRQCKIHHPAFPAECRAYLLWTFVHRATENGKREWLANHYIKAVYYYRAAYLALMELESDAVSYHHPRLIAQILNQEQFDAFLKSAETIQLTQRCGELEEVIKSVSLRYSSPEPDVNHGKVITKSVPTVFPLSPGKPQWLKALLKEEKKASQMKRHPVGNSKQDNEKRLDSKMESNKEENVASESVSASQQRVEKQLTEVLNNAKRIRAEQRLERRKQRHSNRKTNEEKIGILKKSNEQSESSTLKQEVAIQSSSMTSSQMPQMRKKTQIKKNEDKKKEEKKHAIVPLIHQAENNPQPPLEKRRHDGMQSKVDGNDIITVNTINLGLLFDSAQNTPEKNSRSVTPPIPDEVALPLKPDNTPDALVSMKVDPHWNRCLHLPHKTMIHLIVAEQMQEKNEQEEEVYLTFLVGGTLRNTQAGIHHPTDEDYVTNATPKIVQSAFKKVKHLKYLDCHERKTEQGILSVFKFENYPKVEVLSSLILQETTLKIVDRVKKELKRRNFTVNSLALDGYGNLYAESAEVTIHSINRLVRANDGFHALFQRDPLMMLQMVNLSHLFGTTVFQNIPDIGAIVPQYLPLLHREDVTALKLHECLAKLFTRGHAEQNFQGLLALGIFQCLFPSVVKTCGVHHSWVIHQLHEADERFRRNGKCSINRIYMIFVIAAVAGDFSNYYSIPRLAERLIEEDRIFQLNFSGCSYKDSLIKELTRSLLDYFNQCRQIAALAEQQRLVQLHYYQQHFAFFSPTSQQQASRQAMTHPIMLQAPNIIH